MTATTSTPARWTADQIALQALGGDFDAILIARWGAVGAWGAAGKEPGRWRPCVILNIPPFAIWPAMAALGPTLAYDHTAILGTNAAVPAGRAARLSVSALVMYGTASFPFMAETARQLQQAMPHAELRALEGQDHNVSPAALAPLLLEFLT